MTMIFERNPAGPLSLGLPASVSVSITTRHTRCKAAPGGNHGERSIRQLLDRSSAVALSHRRACTRWKTAPPAGWLSAQSRQTPRATDSWRVRRRRAREGCGGRWQNVLSACHRGEPTPLLAGINTLRSWKETEIWALAQWNHLHVRPVHPYKAQVCWVCIISTKLITLKL